MGWRDEVPFATLTGKTLTAVTVNQGNDEIELTTSEGETFRMFHSQDCCESVSIEDICGDISDLIGSPILRAEERTDSESNPPEYAESFTWTFYELATIKGSVTLRWLGRSNGYYSESVSFQVMTQ